MIGGIRLPYPVISEIRDGCGESWPIYRNTKFNLRSSLSHLTIHTEPGNPEEVGKQLLLQLHTHYQHHDTCAENIHESDPHLSAFSELGYFTNSSRIEMRRKNG